MDTTASSFTLADGDHKIAGHPPRAGRRAHRGHRGLVSGTRTKGKTPEGEHRDSQAGRSALGHINARVHQTASGSDR
jgi:hypothetical protein